MLIRHLMTRDVIALDEEARCRDALRLFQEHGIRHAPVVKDGHLLGIVSERDLLRQLPGTVSQLEDEGGWSAEQATVGGVMKREPHTCAPNDPIDEAARVILQRKVGCLPVVEAGRLVGIVTSSDLFRGFASVAVGGDGTRITLMRAKGVGEGGVDPVALCVELGLRVESFLSHRAHTGAEHFLLRVQGEGQALERFLQRAASEGFLLIRRGAEDAA